MKGNKGQKEEERATLGRQMEGEGRRNVMMAMGSPGGKTLGDTAARKG